MNKQNTYKNWLRVQPAAALAPTATPSETAPNDSSYPSNKPDDLQPGTAPAETPAVPQAETTPETTLAEGDAPAATPNNQPDPVAEAAPVQPVAPVAVVKTTPAAAPVTVAAAAPAPAISVPAPSTSDLDNPVKKDVAMQLVSSAENSSLNWKGQYGYIEDIGDGRGYTGGIIGFTSGTHDMLELVRYYAKIKPGNALAAYLSALQKVDGSESHSGLGAGFEAAWKAAASDTLFQKAQNDERDRVYFNPAVSQAKSDGLRALGQFAYYDAMVMHGPGNDSVSFGGIRAAALKKAKTPAQGGNETTYLNAFLDARAAAMRTEEAHEDVDRVETTQRVFLKAGNLALNTPLTWSMYGDSFKIQ